MKYWLILLITVTIHAEVILQVDINNGGSPTEIGHESLVFPGSGDLSGTFIATNGDSIDVLVSNIPNTFGRDRGAGSQSKPDLFRDFVFSGNGDFLELTLSNLDAGTYQITAYHHDNNFLSGTLDIFLTDSLVTNDLVISDLVPSTGSATEAATSVITFVTNGTDNTLIRFQDQGGGGIFATLNGFDVATVPEPSKYLLLLLAILIIKLKTKQNKQ